MIFISVIRFEMTIELQSGLFLLHEDVGEHMKLSPLALLSALDLPGKETTERNDG